MSLSGSGLNSVISFKTELNHFIWKGIPVLIASGKREVEL